MGMTIAIKGFEMPPSCNHCNLCKKGSATDYGQFGDCILMDKRVNLLTWNKDDDCPLTEAIPKADYETRLKADMVAMLTDMLIDVEEIESREQWCDYANDNCISRYDVEDLIQQKINSLKETKDADIK